MTRKMNAHPNAMSRICHHVSLFVVVLTTVGSESPVMDGTGLPELLVDEATSTRSDRQTPNPETMLVELVQFAFTQVPDRRY